MASFSLAVLNTKKLLKETRGDQSHVRGLELMKEAGMEMWLWQSQHMDGH